MDVKMADRLMELRKKNGYSQEQLADRLGISRQAVSKWERAESSPDTDNLIALAKLYGISIDTMLDISETSKGQQLDIISGNDILKVLDSEADEYLHLYKRCGIILGFGIIGVFFAVITLLALLEFVKIENLAFIAFFVVLSMAVGIILSATFSLRRFELSKKQKKQLN